jgi:cobyrinic acid a,c-diamide synthase
MRSVSKKSKKGFVIAGERSGAGKTMITLALARAFMNRGYSVQCFKVGPDFIDPGYHTAVTGRISRNLDGWMTGKGYCRAGFHRHRQDADIAVVEGVMGLYDGYGSGCNGSTAQIATWLDVPVILIVDAGSLAQSAGAVVLGFQKFDPRVKIAGVIFNRVAGKHHYELLRDAVVKKTGVAVLGYIPRSDRWHTPERHLGLVMAHERNDLIASVHECALQLEKTVAINKIVHDSRFTIHDSRFKMPHAARRTPHAETVRIGVARDEAFCFCYQDNIELLQRHGAAITCFSPLHDAGLPDGLQGLYLPGGYPELHAAGLSKNTAMRKDLLAFCRSGKPVYAECGGFLYLLQAITDQQGKRHDMVGFFPAVSLMLPRLQRFGYAEVTARGHCPFLGRGEKIRGHEFHYSDIGPMPRNIQRTYVVSRRKNQEHHTEGYRRQNVLAGYLHLHFASNPDFAKRFVAACAGH